MRLTMIVAISLVATALAGCAVQPGAENEALSLNRQVRIHLDSKNIASDSEDPYDYVESSFVVRVNGESLVPATASITYQDKTGRTVNRSLADFTTLALLTKGTEVRVTGVNLTSDAVLSVNGVETLSRARPAGDWWNVGGYPIGVKMDPGSTLAYRTNAKLTESFSLTDIQGKESETKDIVLDKATLSFGFDYAGDIDLKMPAAPTTVKATSEHSAFPLEWRTNGKLRIPATAEATGRNLSSGKAITAGFGLSDDSGVAFDAHGKLWWNVSNSPVRADLDGGSWSTGFQPKAWVTGIPELEGEFSCAGKTKADNCVPKEFPESYLKANGTMDAEKENLDNFPWDVDPQMVANLTRVLAEDLIPGDEIRFDVDIDSRQMPDYDARGSPDWVHLKGGAFLRAMGYEPVTVAAGKFEALKVVERVEMRLDMGPLKEGGETVTKGFVLEERFIDTTFWLQRDTFVPLRIEQTIPFDLDRIIDATLGSLAERAWKDAPVKALTGKNIDAKVEGTTTIELTQHVPSARFSPYVVLAGFHGMASWPLAAAVGGFMPGGPSYGTATAVPVHMEPHLQCFGDNGPQPCPSTWNPDQPRFVAPEPREAKHISLSSHSPVFEDKWKEYRIESVSPRVSYGHFVFTLDDAYLAYGNDPGSWCLLVQGGTTCRSIGEGYGAMVQPGDALRFSATGITGKTLRVQDGDSGAVMLTIVVR